MTHNSTLMQTTLVISSAGMTAGMFFAPEYAAWLLFFCLVPTFFFLFTSPVAVFKNGFLWGVLFFTLHGAAVLHFIMHRGTGYLGCLAVIFLIGYYGLHTAVWFWVSSFLLQRSVYSWWRAAAVVATTFLFLWWQNTFMMWIIGVPVGYPISFLLIPLAVYPQLLWLLPWAREYTVLVLVLLCNALIARGIADHAARYFVGAFGIILLFLLGLAIPASPLPEYVDELVREVAYCQPPLLPKHPHPLDAAQEITYALQECVQQNSSARVILMPESTYPFVLEEFPYAQELWADNGINEGRTLIIGAHRREEGYLFNTLYKLQECRITFAYDKRWCVPLYEYIPAWWQSCSLLCRLFTSSPSASCKASFFTCARKGKELMPLTGNVHARLLVCSELFCMPHDAALVMAPEIFPGHCIYLCLMNDAWCLGTYYEHLMQLYARYSALKNRATYLYVGHAKALVYAPGGCMTEL